ncbi:MAG: hypothetical protein AABX30_03100 [Nanoarchaeota archaeon]
MNNKRGLNRINKRGQFYLLAAVIIIAVILGFALTTNYLRDKSEVKLYDIGEELGIESENVLDYGVYQGKGNETLRDFTELYSQYAGEGKELYFVFGDKDAITVATYQDIIIGTIDITVGGESKPGLDVTEKKYASEDIIIEEGQTTVNVLVGAEGNKKTYEFNLEPNQNFYFIIAQDIEGETHVIQG